MSSRCDSGEQYIVYLHHPNRRGDKAAEFNNDEIAGHVRSATSILNREDGLNPYLVHEELQEIMQDHVGIIREGEQLKSGIKKLEAMREKIPQLKAAGTSQLNAGWHEALDMRSMLITSEAVAKAGLLREESRGAHTRLDFEGEREEWGKVNIVIKQGATGMDVQKVTRPAPPPELEAIALASIADLESGKV